MGLFTYILFGLSIVIIIMLLKQYLVMWILLDRFNRKYLKYFLPIIEIILLVFISELFLLPSVLTFLILIYDGRVFKDDIFGKYYNIKRESFNYNCKSIIITVLLAPFVYLFSHIISDKLISFISSINIASSYNDMIDAVNFNGFIDYILLFVLTCVIAPVVEEFTFRVLIYRNWLAKVFNKRIIALVFSSLIFALSHFEVTTLPYTLITGIILGFTYDMAGYINTVILHMILNFFTFIQFSGIVIDIKIAIIIYVVITLVLLYIMNLKDSKKINKAKI